VIVHVCMYVCMHVCMIAEGMDGWVDLKVAYLCVRIGLFIRVYCAVFRMFTVTSLPHINTTLMCDMLLQISVCFSSIHCRLRQSL